MEAPTKKINKSALNEDVKQKIEEIKKYRKEAVALFEELQPGMIISIKNTNFKIQKITRKDVILRVLL